MASEVPGFYTRYMATTKEDLGVAVTFSVSKDHYESYQDLFERIIQTIKVFRQKNVKTGDFVPVREGNSSGDILDGPIIPSGDGLAGLGQGRRRKSSGGSDSATDYLIYLVLIGGAAFALVKLRKKKVPKKRKKKKKVEDTTESTPTSKEE
jgi:hypothetical protein